MRGKTLSIKYNQYKHCPPCTLSNSTTVSAKPTTYIATATALANAKIRPMAPPNSGPRLLEIK